MRPIAHICAFLLSLALAHPLLAQTQSVKIFGLVELSGTGTTSGSNFNDGVKLAVKEINAAGGILGRTIEYTANDTQSQPQVAKALAVKVYQKRKTEIAERDGARVLGLDPRQHGRDPARGDPQFHRRRSGRHHAARQPVHLSHVVHAGDGDAEGSALPEGSAQRENGLDHLGEQRLRQGRPRCLHEGDRAAGHQGHRRHLHRSGSARLLRRGAQGQAGQCGRAVRVQQRGGIGAPPPRVAQARLR